MEDQTQNTASSKPTQESTQENEFTDPDDNESTVGDESQSQISSSSKPKCTKDVPSIRPRGKFDSDGPMCVLQKAYDECFVDACCKKDKAAKRCNLKKVKTKLLHEAVSAVNHKRKSLRSVNGTNPPKKHRSSKKYAPVDTPGQRKLTSFVTPSQGNVASTPATAVESQTSFVSSSASNQTTTTPTLDSSVSFKRSPHAFTSPQAIVPAVPDTVVANVGIGSVDTPLLPNMLARHRGVCNGCMLQFHVCHEAKWCDTCLHAVIDYFDQVGYDVITPHGICEAFYERYIALAKTEMLKGAQYYELDDDVPIPNCMVQGSLREALDMVEYNTTIRYLETRRIHDVKGYVRNRSNPPEINKKRFGDDG